MTPNVKAVEKIALTDKYDDNFIFSTTDLENIFLTTFLHIKHDNFQDCSREKQHQSPKVILPGFVKVLVF